MLLFNTPLPLFGVFRYNMTQHVHAPRADAANAIRIFHGAGKPYVRWWWLSGPITRADITRQLRWIQQNGFGGVELAWIHPSWLEEPLPSAPRPAWLSREWIELVTFAKREAEALGLGCDFTFGSSWPFGGSWVRAEDAAQTFDGLSEQRLGNSWEETQQSRGYIVNHLSRASFERYAAPLLAALKDALAGSRSALFCDSLEIATERLWSSELWTEFEERFGYRLQPFVNNLDAEPAVRYDYRKFRGEIIRREFYEAFTDICHSNGAYARVQCHGAPTDLLAAYGAVDVPESEALLFPPSFSRIAASAAAWGGKPVVSAEAFTCLYGFPGWDDSADEYWNAERLGDLKLLADSLFAHGVNQIVWHGMPFQPDGNEDIQFYASVHVGPDSPFAPALPAFNAYLQQVSSFMKQGEAYGGIGVYLPYEDALMQDRIPDEERTPGANFRWEMRHALPPPEIEGFHPLWISHAFLREAQVQNGLVKSRHLALGALYVDCEWLDSDSLQELLRLSRDGARIVWKRRTKQPGRNASGAYETDQEQILQASSTFQSVADIIPLLEGIDLPPYWARSIEDGLLLFFAHPLTKQIGYPLPYDFSARAEAMERIVHLRWNGLHVPLNLHFAFNMPVLLSISNEGRVNVLPLESSVEI